MTLVPRREYALLLVGDLIVFTVALWLTLALRYLAFPSLDFFQLHLVPFSFLFVVWVIVFFIAGLYGRHTRLFRRHLMATILYSQTINMVIAALFFFLVPAFGNRAEDTALPVPFRIVRSHTRLARIAFPATAHVTTHEGSSHCSWR